MHIVKTYCDARPQAPICAPSPPRVCCAYRRGRYPVYTAPQHNTLSEPPKSRTSFESSSELSSATLFAAPPSHPHAAHSRTDAICGSAFAYSPPRSVACDEQRGAPSSVAR